MTPIRARLASTVLACLTALAAAFVLAGAFVRTHTPDDTVRVIGSARRPIRSDFIIWTGTVAQTAPTTDAAYKALTANVITLRAYLKGKGVPDTEVFPSAITTTTLFAPRPKGDSNDSNDDDATVARTVVGYQLSQGVEVRSADVDKVDAIARQSTELISKGVPFQSEAPQYLYTKLSDLKVTMQAEAARDAHARAEGIASASGCRLGGVRRARMSAPVITPLYSSSLSDGGVDDTSSLDKRITAVVTVEYAVK